jgi:thymidylate synthase (FAD)
LLVKKTKVQVLDKGYVTYIDSMGGEESIIEAARMSTDGSFNGWDKDEGLLKYLYSNEHSTPFEMCELLVELQVPLFVVREIQRHRTFSYNEMSGRYIQMPDLHYVPLPKRMVKQSKSNKQASSTELLRLDVAEQMLREIEVEQTRIYSNYQWMLDMGLVREVARLNTPLSRYTRFRMKGNLRNWLHFLKLRLPANVQEETRLFAAEISRIVQALWPRTWALFEEWDLHSLKLSRTQAEEYRAFTASEEFKSWKARQSQPSLTP